MKTLKLSDVQKFRLREAERQVKGVLAEIKAKPLSGEALSDMKSIEECAVNLECVLMGK